MSEHHFELTIRGQLTNAWLDALFEAGCDDATFSSKGNQTFAAFDREAPTTLEAVVSAVEAVEAVAGFEVLRVDPDELVWASEIAERVGRSRQSVDQLVKGQRGPGDFPPPATHATRNPLWRWSEVDAWFAAYEKRDSRPSGLRSWAPSTVPSKLAMASGARKSRSLFDRPVTRLLAS